VELFHYWNILKMGIRFKTGAVPAAVSSILSFVSQCHFSGIAEWEGRKRWNKPEDLPIMILM